MVEDHDTCFDDRLAELVAGRLADEWTDEGNTRIEVRARPGRVEITLYNRDGRRWSVLVADYRWRRLAAIQPLDPRAADTGGEAP